MNPEETKNLNRMRYGTRNWLIGACLCGCLFALGKGTTNLMDLSLSIFLAQGLFVIPLIIHAIVVKRFQVLAGLVLMSFLSILLLLGWCSTVSLKI